MVLLLCAAMLLPLIPAEAAAKAPVSTYEKEPVAAVKEEPEAAVKEEAGQLEKITSFETYYTFETFEDLKKLCAEDYSSRVSAYYKGSNSVLTISENLTIPQNLHIYVDGKVLILIPKGVTVTTCRTGYGEGAIWGFFESLEVNGVLNCGGFEIREKLEVNGKITLNGAVWMDAGVTIIGRENISGGSLEYWYGVSSESELFETLEQAKEDPYDASYIITLSTGDGFTFTKSFAIPDNFSLCIKDNTYTLPAGKTITVNGRLALEGFSQNHACLKIAGSLVNNNHIQIDARNPEKPLLQFATNSTYSGSGTIRASFPSGGYELTDVVSGLDISNLQVTERIYGDWIEYTIQDISDLKKLSTPKNLSWSTTQIGTITWTNGEVTDTSYDYQYYTVKLYRDNVLVDTWNAANKPGNTCSRDLAACWEEDIELKSGTYYFTVQAIPNPNANNSKYKASNIATSPKWTYTRPSKLTTPKNMKTDWPTFSWTGPTSGDFYYYLQIMHAANENDTPSTTCGRWIYSGSSYTLDEQDLKYLRDYFGPGYISIRVRAISNDITKKAHSSFTALSEDYFFDGYVNEPPTVSISNVASTGKIKLSWNAVMGTAKYEVYRATSKTGTYTRLTTVTGTSATNTKADVGKTYYYKVRTVGADGSKSGWSNIVSRTCDLPRPTVTATNVASTGKIKLSWTKIEGAAKYQIVRSLDKTNWEHLDYTTGTSVTNTKTEAGKTYYYKVRAIHSNSAATSAYSAVVSRTCDLAQPTLTVTLNSSGKPKLTWTKVEGATKYQIVRSLDKTNWEHLAYTTGTAMTNSSAVAGKTYYYKIRAIHSVSAATSAYSAIKSISVK